MKLILLLAALSSFASPSGAAEESASPAHAMLYHVVSLKFKESASPAQIAEVETAFAGLKEKVPGIASLHWGTNVSPEQHSHGYTHCFVLTFPGEKERDAYLIHPAPQGLWGIAWSRAWGGYGHRLRGQAVKSGGLAGRHHIRR